MIRESLTLDAHVPDYCLRSPFVVVVVVVVVVHHLFEMYIKPFFSIPFYVPFKIISAHMRRANQLVGRKRENPEKNHLAHLQMKTLDEIKRYSNKECYIQYRNKVYFTQIRTV